MGLHLDGSMNSIRGLHSERVRRLPLTPSYRCAACVGRCAQATSAQLAACAAASVHAKGRGVRVWHKDWSPDSCAPESWLPLQMKGIRSEKD